MTDAAIIAASYAAERNYSHNPDDVIDASDAVGAWGTAKESTTELVDLSGNNNIATIHGAMPTEGFIQGRRFDDDYLNLVGNYLNDYIFPDGITVECLLKVNNTSLMQPIGRGDDFKLFIENNDVGFAITNTSNVEKSAILNNVYNISEYIYIVGTFDGHSLNIFVNSQIGTEVIQTNMHDTYSINIGRYVSGSRIVYGTIVFSSIYKNGVDSNWVQKHFNTLARLPFWSVNYTDYPDNVTIYNSGDNIPYSSAVIL